MLIIFHQIIKILFLNTYGSLYSIDNVKLNVNWLINLNRSFDIRPNNLFLGKQIINNKNKIIVSSNKATFIIDANNGSILYKLNISSALKPVLIDNYLFTVSENLLICIDVDKAEIIYSHNINEMISEYFDTKKLKKHKIYPLNIKCYK